MAFSAGADGFRGGGAAGESPRARRLFHGIIAGALCAIAFDIGAIVADRTQGMAEPSATTVPVMVRQAGRPSPPHAAPARAAFRPEPMRFLIHADGRLEATGLITQGSAARLEQELMRLGGAVTAVSLDSPGGAVGEAVLMAQEIRARGLATKVGDGALCASSCPLVLAGGMVRQVDDGAVVGLHQFRPAGAEEGDPARAVADAQLTTAQIVRHLSAMGVDPALWLLALDTPPQELYRLSADELAAYRLASPRAAD